MLELGRQHTEKTTRPASETSFADPCKGRNEAADANEQQQRERRREPAKPVHRNPTAKQAAD